MTFLPYVEKKVSNFNMTITTRQIHDKSNSWGGEVQEVKLTNGQWVNVPDGADPEHYRRYRNALLERKANGKRTRRTRRRRTSKRTNYAAQVIARGKAQAELVKRVNEAIEDTPFWNVESAGQSYSVSRDGKVTYND